MTQPMRKKLMTDEVDRLVDSLLTNPDRVDDIKSQIRRRIMASRVVPLSSVPPSVRASSEDEDDMWDNVPV